jgi:formyl-CoA transferase
MAQKPLKDVRVIDMTNVIAGPFCCHNLAHLGAEVIKVEAPVQGDAGRILGQDYPLSEQKMGTLFLGYNPGKRSMTLNLKTEEGKAVFRRLVAESDVLVENFRSGVMDRLGLGYEVLKEINPRLIYCAISGFGQEGPLSDRPAYDQIIQGMSGVMAITGCDSTAPLRAGWPVADTVGGITASMGICAALNANPRGAFLDVSMLDSLIASMGWAVSSLLAGNIDPFPAGNENPTSSPSGCYECADGQLNIATNKQKQWEDLADHLGLGHLKHDPRFADREGRVTHRHALNAEIQAVLITRSCRDWETELNALGIPAGLVLSMREAVEHPAYRSRDQVARYNLDCGREINVVRTGLHVNGAPLAVDRAPPKLGEDTDHVLEELGFPPHQIEAFRAAGAV